LKEIGTKFAFVGQVTVEGTGVYILRDGKAVYYSDIHCEQDELARIWALYPRRMDRPEMDED